MFILIYFIFMFDKNNRNMVHLLIWSAPVYMLRNFAELHDSYNQKHTRTSKSVLSLFWVLSGTKNSRTNPNIRAPRFNL